LEIFKNNFMVS